MLYPPIHSFPYIRKKIQTFLQKKWSLKNAKVFRDTSQINLSGKEEGCDIIPKN